MVNRCRGRKIKLHGFNNLTKSLSFNIYDICYTRSKASQIDYLEYVDEEYNSEKLRSIVEEVTSQPGVLLSQVDILSVEERRQILEEFKYSRWENGAENYPQDKRMEELFEEQVSRTPDHIAVVFEDRQITFRQLDERVNRISKLIKEL